MIPRGIPPPTPKLLIESSESDRRRTSSFIDLLHAEPSRKRSTGENVRFVIKWSGGELSVKRL